MKNKKLKTLLMTGVLTLGLCVGCGNNNSEELTSLQEKYDNSQKIVEQYKKDNEKLKEQNKALEQDKKTAESKLKELQSKEEPADITENTTNNTTENAATESSNNDVWYTCEKCGVTNGKVKLHGAFYMCPNCIAKQDNSSNTTIRRNTNNYNRHSRHNSYKKYRKSIKRRSSFDKARDDVTTNQHSKGYVYWTPGGKSYHSRRSCPTLKRSKTVCGGYNCPKTDPCNICYR